MKATKVVFSLAEARLSDERSKKNAALAAFNLNGGADGRDRTCDLLVTNELLYQLSYIGTPCRNAIFEATSMLETSTSQIIAYLCYN